jgi:hypothetical protein
MVFQLRRKILSSRSHQETSPDEEISDSALSHSRSRSRERDEESGRDVQVEDAGINNNFHRSLEIPGMWSHYK